MSRMKLLTPLLWLAALLLAAWTLAQVPLRAIAANLAELSWFQWSLWSALNALIVLTFAWRWHVLNGALELRLRFTRLLLIRQAGQAISFITPGPQFGGEPLQVYWLWRLCALPLHRALLALGLDRFYELWINLAVLTLAILILLAEPVVGMPAWRDSLLLLAALVAALGFGVWIVLGDTRRLGAGLARLTRRWSMHPRLRQAGDHWQNLRQDLQDALRLHKPRFAWALGMSVCGWMLLFAELALTLRFVGVNPELPAFLFLFVAMRLAMLLPVPGGIGTIEAALLWSFQLLGLPAASALGLIALMRLRDVAVLLVGLACLYRVRRLQERAAR